MSASAHEMIYRLTTHDKIVHLGKAALKGSSFPTPVLKSV